MNALSLAASSLPGRKFALMLTLSGGSNEHATARVKLFVTGLLPSLTTEVTVCGPQLSYTCAGPQSLLVAPSPKFQTQLVETPTRLVMAPLKTVGWFGVTMVIPAISATALLSTVSGEP